MTKNINWHIIFLLLLFLLPGHYLLAQVTANDSGIWMTYYSGKNLEKDFADMKNHGIDAVEVGIWGIEGNSRAEEILEVARKSKMKLIIGIPEVSEEAFNIPEGEVERAVMLGGAYKGKAIDRFRFAFTPEKHNISIESPVYDSTNCYGSIGKYFIGLTPVRAEVIIKQKDFDGSQHLKIIDAHITPQKEHFWNMTFDLTNAEGDLENVLLAVYWTAEGTRDYWIFGDAVSLFSEGFKMQLSKEVSKVVNGWKKANGGAFPPEVIAVRYGDECFHLSGHLNSEACSFPVWDYSRSAITRFRETCIGEIPRGVDFTDMFGHEAYARFMYNFHEAAALTVKAVKECLKKEGVGHIPVFRNTTRMNIFDVLNDYDGSGQELLSKAFDILHLDPYPVHSNGYNLKTIPRDMAYMEGFSRRFNKPLVPWMQAHVYGHRQHPTPGHITQMMKQQKQFQIHSIMWLGYGFHNSGNTFPENNAASWEKASEEHLLFRNFKSTQAKADFAAVRPYTARSIKGVGKNNADRFLTDYLLEAAVFDFNLRYDAFEPFDCSVLSPAELESYSFIVAETGVINKKNLQPFVNSHKPCILIAAGAEIDPHVMHILGIKRIRSEHTWIEPEQKRKIILLDSNARFELNEGWATLYQINNEPAIWQKDNLVVIGHLPHENQMKIASDLLNTFTK